MRVKGAHQVKVHKLNEMGEIVDKKGHRAWDMACALQLGIRVNVRDPQSFCTFHASGDVACLRNSPCRWA